MHKTVHKKHINSFSSLCVCSDWFMGNATTCVTRIVLHLEGEQSMQLLDDL